MNPLSAIYAAAVSGRNRLYDSGALKPKRLRGPVVSVGNISVGGSGKTPFVILLGELLHQRGVLFDVLSRGYRRRTRGPRIVDPNGRADEFGDEPLLIARRLDCPVVVGESRHEAGLLAEKSFGPQLHILDDGFQHRQLTRDFDVVLVSPEDVNDKLLPAGRLREPLSSLQRADAIVLPEGLEFKALGGKPLWRIRRGVQIADAPARPVIFCGIARPQRFLEQLKERGVVPVAERFFRDHHAYTDGDVRSFLQAMKSAGGTGFITTEKDAINLGELLPKLGQVTVARVCMELVNAADALDTMLRSIAERRASA